MPDFIINICLLFAGYISAYIYLSQNKTIPGERRSWEIIGEKGRSFGSVESMTVDEVCLFCNRYYGNIAEVYEEIGRIFIKQL
jgi:hypothetical protein